MGLHNDWATESPSFLSWKRGAVQKPFALRIWTITAAHVPGFDLCVHNNSDY